MTGIPTPEAVEPLNARCRHCGDSVARLLLLAMLQDAGARSARNANLCSALQDEGEHDFVWGKP